MPAYDMDVLSDTLDQINIMSYGAECELGLCASTYISSGFPAQKLIGGIEAEIDYKFGADTLGDDGSIARKAQYALSNGLAGMMEWRLDNDYTIGADSNFPTYKGAMQLWTSMQSLAFVKSC